MSEVTALAVPPLRVVSEPLLPSSSSPPPSPPPSPPASPPRVGFSLQRIVTVEMRPWQGTKARNAWMWMGGERGGEARFKT
eukprot:768463-Hanusia_phi.AAC.10